MAANPNTENAPNASNATTSIHICRLPANHRTGTSPRLRARPTLAHTSTGLRRQWSTYTPATSPRAAYGTNCAALTTPTSNGLAPSNWTTKTGIATAEIADPMELSAAATQKRTKAERVPSPALSPTTPLSHGEQAARDQSKIPFDR